MLVLTRKKGESIILGNDIELTILDIEGEQIKLGINAPKNIEIHRKEVYMMIQNENKEAASRQNISIDNLKQLLKEKKDKDTK